MAPFLPLLREDLGRVRSLSEPPHPRRTDPSCPLPALRGASVFPRSLSHHGPQDPLPSKHVSVAPSLLRLPTTSLLWALLRMEGRGEVSGLMEPPGPLLPSPDHAVKS